MEQYRETFNDGVLVYGHKITKRSETGKRIGETFTAEGKLFFREMSCRQSDYEFSNAIGSRLDLKVKTPYPPSFRKIDKNKMLVQIDGIGYEIINVDHDTTKQFLFFLLQRVGGINE